MPDNTPVYGWPVPILGDPPDISQIETLADAQEVTLSSLLTAHGALIYRSSGDGDTANIPGDGSLHQVGFPTTIFDTDGYKTSNSVLTVPTGLGGYYAYGASVRWGPGSGGTYREVFIDVNNDGSRHVSAQSVTTSFPGGAGPHLTCAGVIHLNAGDYLQCNVRQDSSSGIPINQLGQTPNFWLFRIPTG